MAADRRGGAAAARESRTTGSIAEPLEGRIAIVTGASRGIGLACATSLARAGATVVMLARSRETLESAARAAGKRAIPLVCDIAKPAELANALEETSGRFGGAPDILISNAGFFRIAPVEETSAEDFETALRVNLIAPFAIVRELIGPFRERGSGHVVTVGSVADRNAFPGNAAYAASKFGLRALHEVVRQELRGSGVRATLISPGPVNTQLWDPVDPDARPGFTPRAAMLSPGDVADAVMFVVTRPPSVNIDELRLSRA